MAAAAMSFALGSTGNVRTRTFRAYDIEEMGEILGQAYDLHINGGSLR